MNKNFFKEYDSNFRNNSGPQTQGGLCDDFGLIADSPTTTIGHTNIQCSDRERRRNANMDISPGGVAESSLDSKRVDFGRTASEDLHSVSFFDP